MLLLVYGVALLVAVLLSERFNRTLLSAAVLFLIVGLAVGPAAAGLVRLTPGDPLVRRVSDLALVSVLFSDALQLGWTQLRRAWRLPGRAIFFGLPLTMGGVAAAAVLLFDLGWHQAVLLGAILSPTDPVFASAIVGRKEIPLRLRHLLNVESGLNDGLALPVIVVLMDVISGTPPPLYELLRETVGGLALGVGIAAIAGYLRRLRLFDVSRRAAPLHAMSVLLIAYAASTLLAVNSYLAAFGAGVSLATACGSAAEDFGDLGDQAVVLLKLAAVLLFGVMLGGALPVIRWVDYAFGAVVLGLVRFVAIELALFGGGLTVRERLAAGWFGPKGFASIIYAVMLLQSTVPLREQMFNAAAAVIAMSIVLHSSTDVPLAKLFARAREVSR